MYKYVKEAEEWQQIARELGAKNSTVTAFDVSDEQRKRMATRGERPMTYEETLADVAKNDL